MLNFDKISIKSRIGVENRRYELKYNDAQDFETFYTKVETMHQLRGIPFTIFYTDLDNVNLPINNDYNLAKAIKSAKCIHVNYVRSSTKDSLEEVNNEGGNYPDYTIHYRNRYYPGPPPLVRRPYLKILIQRKGPSLDCHDYNSNGKCKRSQNFIGFPSIITSSSSSNDQNSLRPSIGVPEDFRQVSSIIDVDSVPKTCRRVRIVKHGSDKPLGFYIRDGTYKRMNALGQVELVTGVFISRLVPGGLAESTGLLAVNDEVLEVNGIQVMHGKTLDQVTDMMVANSSNLIMTIRPGRMNYIS